MCNHPPRIPFNKPPITLEAQVALLQARGLIVPDRERAAHYLKFIGYYRLSGYWRYFTDDGDERRERFRPGTSFDSVLDLYIFDRKLRVLLLDAFERIEVALKASMSQHVALATNAFWPCDPANFSHGLHEALMRDIREAIRNPEADNPQHVFIKHFYKKYSDPWPPTWMVMETLSFGMVSRIYKALKGALRNPVAAEFQVQHDVLESWLHALSFARNVCAHHCRAWNRRYTIKPKIPKPYRELWPASSQNRLYVLCCILHHMLNIIADDSGWAERLRTLIRERPGVPLESMGFPENWDETAFWNFA